MLEAVTYIEVFSISAFEMILFLKKKQDSSLTHLVDQTIDTLL